jgi:hypothetical protein
MSAKAFQQLTPDTIHKFVFNDQLAETVQEHLKDWVVLEPWQKIAVTWMVKKELKHFRGLAPSGVACGILGYSMGLGKIS